MRYHWQSKSSFVGQLTSKCSFNYTLNKFKNTSFDLHRVSIQADYINNYATHLRFDSLVKTDLLLYYLSLVYPNKSMFEMHWYPDCSIYNHGVEVLPKLASKRFFEKAKVLFGVNTVDEYKELVSSLNDQTIIMMVIM